ncbi:ABC transporter B family member 15 [Vitis vinifera]|uniref:ABC transporter B family member 15 n=1 Tax=Vitis vinifera TaxID=29760 RepID=A0A438JIF4_VITVI|nr:ABC transporter B family member 15 [Vitis vinifera]
MHPPMMLLAMVLVGALSSYEWLSEIMVMGCGPWLLVVIAYYPGVYVLPASFALPWIGEAETLFVFPWGVPDRIIAPYVRSLVGDRMALVVQTFSVVTIACAMGLIIAWRLVVVMIAVQPLIIVYYYTRRVLLKSMSAKAIKAQEESSKLAAEVVSNLRTITIFSSQARILKMFEVA